MTEHCAPIARVRAMSSHVAPEREETIDRTAAEPETVDVAHTRWRATGPYSTINTSKAGILEETRQFILAYDQTRNISAARHELLTAALPQRSRVTRATIVKIILHRLANWSPPDWLWGDLLAFARDERPESLRAALLLHVTRQDTLLYDFVQEVVVPRWSSGERELSRAHVQRFLDRTQSTHPEIAKWSHETREKLAGNTLSILRDYGLLAGTARKHIVEPLVPEDVAQHLVRLLRAEGVTSDELPLHPDWRIWLWDDQRIRTMLATLQMQEKQA